jgi:SAM-dependent methyltransferase
MKCRFCGHELTYVFIDLVAAPPSNSFLKADQINAAETYYPLKVYVCDSCFLVQVDEYKQCEEIFCDDYVYFSSMSRTWLEHSHRYVNMISERLRLNEKSMVVEVASNDGYLLQYFLGKDIPCLGIEPTDCTAQVAIAKGIPVIEDFFGTTLARRLAYEGKSADLILGNNVLAHVPDINDFVEGLKLLLKQTGTITMEFPHLLQLIQNTQFDTIYHEHFSYLSFGTVCSIFRKHDLEVYDVEELPTHGGSLRIYAKHSANLSLDISEHVSLLLEKEMRAGMDAVDFYINFKNQVLRVKLDFLSFLIDTKRSGKKVAAYGAAAKGNTLLNFCGVKNDLIEFVVDAAPSKQGRFLPGSHIPVVKEELLKEKKPDYIIIFPWNIQDEIMKQLHYIRGWGARFIVCIPHLKVL